MLDLDMDGRRIKTVLPNIPYFQDLYRRIGEAGGGDGQFNEHEQVTLTLMERLGRGPATRDDLASFGADKKALARVLTIGKDAGFVLPKKARGQEVFISPGYFADDPRALADLVAKAGSTRVARLIRLIRDNQGYPLRLIRQRRELGGVRLDDRDLEALTALAGEGFLSPPAIRTSHAGENHFIFGPQPGSTRLAPHETQIYRNALALASAVRQGQLLASQYAIKFPVLLLERLKERGSLGSNSEAMEQYKVVAEHGVGRLDSTGGGQARFELIRNPDNIRAVDMAIAMLSGASDRPGPDEELILALRSGERYVEPLLARKSLAEHRIVCADEESRDAIETLLLGGRS